SGATVLPPSVFDVRLDDLPRTAEKVHQKLQSREGENFMTRTITLRVNGKEHTVEVPVQRLLIDCLRYDLGLTGTKEGCSVGVCGACTVLMNGEMISSC